MSDTNRGQREIARLLGLGGVTAFSVGLTVVTAGSVAPSEKVPEVNGLDSAPPGGGEWPFVSVIVPARNEERNLPRVLSTLLRQRYPGFEVIVVDDRSDDATPRILEEYAARFERLKVVKGERLPREEGWFGKPHAMSQGARAAGGTWLLFTDADTAHSPDSLASSVAFALRRGVDLLSIFPYSELVTPAERLLMPVAFQGIATLYPAGKVNDPRSKVAIANGQYMLIRREVYDAVGGIERVKGKIAEDLEFGKVVKGDGYRLYLADGRRLMRVRMYTNLRELWEGWSKNIVLSFLDNPAAGFFGSLAVPASLGIPPLMLRWALRARRRAGATGGPTDRAAAIWISLLAGWNLAVPLLYKRRVDQALGLPPGWALTYPVGVALFGVLMLYSAGRLILGKGVTWKGRMYAARSR